MHSPPFGSALRITLRSFFHFQLFLGRELAGNSRLVASRLVQHRLRTRRKHTADMTRHTRNQIQARFNSRVAEQQEFWALDGSARRHPPPRRCAAASFVFCERVDTATGRACQRRRATRGTKHYINLYAARRTPCLRPLLRLPQQARLPPPLDWIAHQHPRREHHRTNRRRRSLDAPS